MTDEFIEDFSDKAEELPGGYIIQRELLKAVKGENFFYNDEETGKPIRCAGVPMDEFFYYYKIWENFHYFGLPQGKGWDCERTWLLEFLKAFEKSNEAVKFYIESRMNKKGNMT